MIKVVIFMFMLVMIPSGDTDADGGMIEVIAGDSAMSSGILIRTG